MHKTVASPTPRRIPPHIYVQNGDTATVIQPGPNNTDTVVGTINLPVETQTLDGSPFSRIGLIAVSPTGPDAGDVYVPNLDSVAVIDPTTNTIVATVDIGSFADRGFPLLSTFLALSPTGPEAGDAYTAVNLAPPPLNPAPGAFNPTTGGVQVSVISP